MNENLEKIPNYYRRQVKLDLPPGASFLYHSENNMCGNPLLPSVYTASEFSSEYTSDDVIVVGHAGAKQYILVGAVTAYRSQTFLVLIRSGANMQYIEIRQPDIMEGETPEEVVVLKGDDWRELLVQYGNLLHEKMQVATLDTKNNLTGYCTWYYYYADVTEQDFLDNLQALIDKKDSGYRAQVVQIDDGYQTFQGDWNDQDPSWPTPLAEIGKRISDSGMTGGIWTMPFQASTASRVFREHPDWFVKNENDEPLVAKGWSPPPDDLWATLDGSNPEVQAHLGKIFRTFHDWGFNYFKMDGLGFALIHGKRHDPNATPVSAFRDGLKAIREAVPDAYLLGCCPPFLPCLGYTDGCRVSQDTAARWSAIRGSLFNVTSRWWMIDRLFRCDPDTLMARQDRAWHTIGEARISVLTGILTGVSITSDNLATIAPERLELLARAASLRLRDPRPLDQYQGNRAMIFAGTVDDKPAVAIFNHSEGDLDFNFEKLGFDKTKEAEELLQPLGMRKYLITVQSHDAVLLVQKD